MEPFLLIFFTFYWYKKEIKANLTAWASIKLSKKGTLCYFVGYSRLYDREKIWKWIKKKKKNNIHTYVYTQLMQSHFMVCKNLFITTSFCQRKRTPSHLTFAAFVLNPFLARLYTPIFINLLSASISFYELMWFEANPLNALCFFPRPVL